MKSNRTFTMLKPDSIEQGFMLPILNMIQDAGFNIIALKYKKMTTDEAEQFYSIHSDKPFFKDLIAISMFACPEIMITGISLFFVLM